MLNLNGHRLILASSSPRRAELIKLFGVTFEIIHSEVDEENEHYTMPEVQVLELAQKKAFGVAAKINRGFIIGADTVVVLDNEILGKPRNSSDAKKMLSRLSGKSHTVYTGYAISHEPSGEMISDYEKTEVRFRDLSFDEIEAYVKTGNPLDKAGAYGIQDQSAIFVKSIDGCFYNVMGFPISKIYQRLSFFAEKYN